VFGIQVECSQVGALETVQRQNLLYPVASDEYLQVVDKFSPCSTYLIDGDGTIRARWLDSIHNRGGPETVIEAILKLGK
jgi:peroxiredoxin